MIGRVRHVPPVDRLDFEEGSLLLYERTLVSLSVLGAAVVRHTAEPTSVADLADRLREEFGDPVAGSVEAATASVVDALVGTGVLEPLPEAGVA